VNEPARRAANGSFSQTGSEGTRHGPRLMALACLSAPQQFYRRLFGVYHRAAG